MAAGTLSFWSCFTIFFVVFCPTFCFVFSREIGEEVISTYREKVRRMFYHAYDNYLKHAYPYDELRPLSCDGVDTWGSFSLTLIDALDTLAVMGNYSEFRRVAQLLVERADFDVNINVSVFETNIRVVGGLLSAHLFSHRAAMKLEPGWPCSGPLLRLAEDLARRLLPAFKTETGMPYGTVNLRHGVPVGETTVTCTAGVATYIVEFGALSRLTGDPSFENAALGAIHSLWALRSPLGLVGNHVDVLTGRWTAVESGIGAGVDSYFEYLVKGAILLQRPELIAMFNEYRSAIDRHIMHEDWYMWVNMQKGHVTMPVFQSLEAFWPGLLSLVGDLDSALKSIHNYHQVWKQYGFTPEFYNIPQAEPNTNREGYPLRPELAESVMYLYRATKDPIFLKMGIDIVESINHSARTPCGFATIKDVRTHAVEDRMESFFLAETTKYLYLLFDPDNFLHADGRQGRIVQVTHGECVLEAGGYIFNTEAHPIDAAAVYCCSAAKEEGAILQKFHDNMDLLSVLGLSDSDALKDVRPKRRSKVVAVPTESGKLIKNDPVISDEEIVEDTSQIVVQSNLVTEHYSTETSLPIAGVTVSGPDTPFVNSEIIGSSDMDAVDDESVITITGEANYVGEVDFEMETEGEPEVSTNDREESSGEEVETEGEPELSTNDRTESSQEEDGGESNDKTSSGNIFWAGTKPILSNILQRDTLQSAGLLGNIVKVNMDSRNSSILESRFKLNAGYDIMSCPAQPFLMRLSVMGEMYGVVN